VIVEVLVMVRGVQPKWGSKPGEPLPSFDAVSAACFFTNDFNVPGKLNSTGRDGPSIVIRTDSGTVIAGSRAVLGVPPFESNREYLHASGDATYGARLVSVTRGVKPFNACFVPVLLAIQGSVSVGEWVDVRIRPPSADGVYYIDDRWYRMRVDAFESPSDKAQSAGDGS